MIALVFMTSTAHAGCWEDMAQGDNAAWVITKSILSPFVCIPSDIVQGTVGEYTGQSTTQIYNVTTKTGTTTYYVTPTSTGGNILVAKP